MPAIPFPKQAAQEGARLRAWHEAAQDFTHQLRHIADVVNQLPGVPGGSAVVGRLRSLAHSYKGWRDWRDQQRELSEAWKVLGALDRLTLQAPELESTVVSMEHALEVAAAARVVQQRPGGESPDARARFRGSVAGVQRELDDLAFQNLGGRGVFFPRVRQASGMLGEILVSEEGIPPEERREVLRRLSEVRGELEGARRDWLRYIEDEQDATMLPQVQVFARVIGRYDKMLREGEADGVIDNAFGAAPVEQLDHGLRVVDWRGKRLRSRGERQEPIRGVALHYTGGTSVAGSVYTLRQIGFSYHYIIDRDGTIYQTMDESLVAGHAGRGKNKLPDHDDPDQILVGIAFANIGYERPSDGLPARKDWISAEGRRWEPYTVEQLQAASELTRQIFERHELEGKGQVWTHSELAPGRKHDPGPVFPLARFRQRVAENTAPAVASLDESNPTGPYLGAAPAVKHSSWRDWWWLPVGTALFGGLALWERRK